MEIRIYGILEIIRLQHPKLQHTYIIHPEFIWFHSLRILKTKRKKNNITKTITVTSPTPQPPISNPLSYNSIITGSLFFATDTLWYSFNVTNGVTYSLEWDDSYDGSGAYTADILVDVFKADLTTAYISGGDSGYTSQPSFTATETGTVYVSVTPYLASTGTFALRYY